MAFPEKPLQAHILRENGKKIPRATTTSLGEMIRRFLIEHASKYWEENYERDSFSGKAPAGPQTASKWEKKIPRTTTTSLGKMFWRFLIENASKCWEKIMNMIAFRKSPCGTTYGVKTEKKFPEPQLVRYEKFFDGFL